MAINLLYRIKRFFNGESGVVERVEPQAAFDRVNYFKDSDGNLPKRIFIRNLLGELVEMDSPLVLESIDSFKDRTPLDYEIYKQYKLGDKFP